MLFVVILYMLYIYNTMIAFSKVFSEMYSRLDMFTKKIKLSSVFCLLLHLTSPKISVLQLIYCLNGCSAQC